MPNDLHFHEILVKGKINIDLVNQLRPGQDGRHVEDDSLELIYSKEMFCTSIKFAAWMSKSQTQFILPSYPLWKH